MPLTNTQLRYYDHNVLRLAQNKRSEYTEQVNRLIINLTKKLHEHTEFKVSKVRKAGSFAKHTILRKAEGRKADIDVAFYLRPRDVTVENYDGLCEEIHAFLISLYPTKHIEDFEIQRKAATVSFVGSGLDVDLVPVVEEPMNPEYGWQYGTDGSKTLTCVSCQINFVRKRKDVDVDFRTLVRLAKQWRHYNEIPGLKSYSIELLMAYLLDQHGVIGSLEERLRKFFLYIVQSDLAETVSFPENPLPLGSFSSPVVIVDPVNSQNNVGARITASERQTVITKANTSWEAAHYASIKDDLDVWKEIFGPRFKVEN